MDDGVLTDRVSRILFTADQIDRRTSELAAAIVEDYTTRGAAKDEKARIRKAPSASATRRRSFSKCRSRAIRLSFGFLYRRQAWLEIRVPRLHLEARRR